MMSSRFRYRLRQWKTRPFHLISQLDMVRLWDRILRRSGVPILYSQGFNPRPLLSFGPATPLGIESKAEYLEMLLGDNVSPLVLQEILNRYLPSGLRVESVTVFPLQVPSLVRDMKGVVYGFSFPGFFAWKDVRLPEGVKIQETYQDGLTLRVFFLFQGEQVFSSPVKFASFLRESCGCPLPETIVKEAVLFFTGG